MIRFGRAFSSAVLLACTAFGQAAQSTPPQSGAPGDKAGAYYNFAMGRLYAELAATEGNKNDYVTKAVQHYQEALKLDPGASIIFEELTDLYIQTGRLKDAVAQSEDMLKRNPDNLDARRMLGRIYMRMLNENNQGRINESYVRLAMEQFQAVTEKDPKDAESFVMLGRLYRLSSKSPEAEKAYNAALAVDPENEDALTGLALMYAELGDSKRAVEKLKAVTEKSPSERLFAILADQYEQLHDYKNAAEVLKKAYEMAPENGRIARGLARDLLYSDQLDESLKLYQQLATEDTRDPQLPLSIAQIYQAKRDLAKAREALNKAKALDGENLEVRYQDVKLLDAEGKHDASIAGMKAMLDDTARKTYTEAESHARSTMLEEYGILLRTAEKYPLAVEAFRQMAALGGDSAPRATVQVIDTYRQAKDSATALKEADAAVKKYPSERMIKVEHATVLTDMGKVDEGVAELRGMLDGQRDRETYLTIAQVYEKSKRFSEMAKALDEAERLSKSDEDKINVYFMRGAMFERQKKFDASETEFRKVLKVDPENAGALNYLGYMLADRSVRLEEAYQMIRKALDLDPDNGAYLDSIGWVYYRQGKLTEAESSLIRALDRSGEDATIHDHLGDVYAKEGKTREAIAQWQASLKNYKATPDADPDDVAKVTRKLDDARVRLAQETKKK